MREIHIDKTDIRQAKVVDVTPAPLAAGGARLRLDLFALTANNITYAAMGEGVLGYWDFFPGPDGWGKPPCWGFATVTASNAPGVDVGTRVYGYFPIAETLDVVPAKANPRAFVDDAVHRRAKAAIYNRYFVTGSDPAYDADREAEQAIFRPLYGTGWWAADFVHRGSPRSVVFSSASSKTALATAHQLKKLGGAELIGLTSPNNEAFVRETGLYAQTLTYEAIGTLAPNAPVTYLDFLGRTRVSAAVHRTLGATLTRSVLVGVTDWNDKPGGVQPPKERLDGPTPEFFFVPTYAAGRLKDEPDLAAATQADMRAFCAASHAYVEPKRIRGTDAILESWARLVGGDVPPREGLVLSF